MTEIDKGFKEKHEGSTRTKASYSINKDGENTKVKINFSVRKSGVSGTGRGVLVFVLINDSAEPVWKYEKGFTVGADAVDGVNEKDNEVEFTVYNDKWDNVFGSAFYIDSTKDTTGIPSTLPDFIDAFKNLFKDVVDIVNIFKSLPIGESTDIIDWTFKKLK